MPSDVYQYATSSIHGFNLQPIGGLQWRPLFWDVSFSKLTDKTLMNENRRSESHDTVAIRVWDIIQRLCLSN